MKKLLTILSFVLLAICVQAQTNSSITITNQLPVDEQTFFSSAESYLTSFNPEFTFTNVVLEVGTGYKLRIPMISDRQSEIIGQRSDNCRTLIRDCRTVVGA